MSPTRDAPAVPATRLACDRCHDHKLRCDRSPITGEPCRRCARVKAECRYGRPRRFGRPRKRKDSVAEARAASSPGATSGAPSVASHESSAPSQAPTARLVHRDSGFCDIDSPGFYKVEDACLGKDVTPAMSGLDVQRCADALLSEGALYEGSWPPMDDTDWLGADMATNDIDMSLFPGFDPDNFIFTEDGRLPTPPDSPDSDSENMVLNTCFPASEAFPGATVASPLTFTPPGPASGSCHGDGGIVEALTQLHLRLHQISALPQEPLLEQPGARGSLIEETIRASQTFVEILRSACQPDTTTLPSPVSPTTKLPCWHSSLTSSLSPSSCCSPKNTCSPPLQPALQPQATTESGSSPIGSSASLLALVCYVRVTQSCRDVLHLLRRVMSGGVDTSAGAGANVPSLDALGTSMLLPQITIGSVRPMSSSPRVQVALLAQLLASILDEVRSCISQLVDISANSGIIDDARGGEGGSGAAGGRPTSGLMRLAEEGVARDEAELKSQLLAMTQLLA